MRGRARAGTALLRSGALRNAAGRGLDLVNQVGDTAAEVIRSRRDPALVARRRQLAARRRVIVWSVAAMLFAAVTAFLVVGAVRGDVSAASIGTSILAAGLLVYSALGLVTAGVDLRTRTAVVRRLPPPQPARQAVAAPARALIQRLDGYSDAMRQAAGMIGAAAAHPDLRALRDETLAAADDAERRLRRKAAELTGILRGGAPAAGTPMAATCRRLLREIGAGVDEYGRLAAAASGTAAATADLAARSAPAGNVSEMTDRLNAVADGMREIIESGSAGA